MASALRQALDLYGSRLGIDGSAKIVADASGTETIMSWLKARGVSWPHIPQINTMSKDLSDLAPLEKRRSEDRDWETVQTIQFNGKKLAFPEHSITHVVLDLAQSEEAERVEVLKWVVYCLQPKGIAVLHLGNSVTSEDSLKLLLEGSGSGFERGKVRAHEIEGGWVALAIKFDLLTA